MMITMEGLSSVRSSTSSLSNISSKKSPSLCNTNSDFYELLIKTQLESFWPLFRDQLQITRLEHFNYVKIKDLEKIGMSKPAVRRLFDAVNKQKQQDDSKSKLAPTRPPPPPPSSKIQTIQKIGLSANDISKNITKTLTSHDQLNKSKLYNNNLNKAFLKSKLLNLTNNYSNNSRNSRANSADSSSISQMDDDIGSKQPVSFIINPNDIEILKTNNGKDQVLGYGHFGIVKKAVWTTHTGSRIKVAVKCLHDNVIESNNGHEAFIDIVNEVSNMCGLNHKNLIKLHGIAFRIDTDNDIKKSYVMMITELANYGSLQSHLKNLRQKSQSLPLSILYSYIFQIASGMDYLESKKLIHRDLATRNILLSSLTHVKICDFGMTRSVKNGFYKMIEKHKIPCAWWPPESIREKIFSIKSDVWMFGVTSWEIFSLGEHPWPNLNSIEILNKIENEMQRLEKPELCSQILYSILLQCWSNNPNDRPTFEMIRKLVKEIKIVEMKAKSDYKQEDRLEMIAGDKIVIIEGIASKYWWQGQNQRTLLVGSFPRAILDPQRPITCDDISLPLKNSFIHAGHMSSNSNQKSWGNPSKIDELFLTTPLNPPDLLDDLNKNDDPNGNVEIISNLNLSDSTKQTDLINLLEDEIKTKKDQTITISYPDKDYAYFHDSFSSVKTKSISNTSSPSINSNINNYNNNFDLQNYYNSNYNTSSVKQINKTSSYVNDSNCYYNSDCSYLNNTRDNKEQESISNEWSKKFSNNDDNFIYNVPNSNLNINKNNPFYDPLINNQINSTNKLAKTDYIDDNQQHQKLELTQSKFNFNQDNLKMKNLNVDDYLKRVMNDVFNDLNNVKLQSSNF